MREWVLRSISRHRTFAFFLVAFSILIAACIYSQPNSALENDLQPPWVAETQECVSRLVHNQYTLGKNELDCSRGIADLDCSGFTSNLFREHAPQIYARLLQYPHRNYPPVTAYDWLLKKESRSPISFEQLHHILEIKGGDLIWWIHTPSPSDGDAGQVTGHIMLAMDKPKGSANSKDVFRIQLADSALSGHADDSRAPGQTGLGIGFLCIKTDAIGAPIAFDWQCHGIWNSSSVITLARPKI